MALRLLHFQSGDRHLLASPLFHGVSLPGDCSLQYFLLFMVDFLNRSSFLLLFITFFAAAYICILFLWELLILKLLDSVPQSFILLDENIERLLKVVAAFFVKHLHNLWVELRVSKSKQSLEVILLSVGFLSVHHFRLSLSLFLLLFLSLSFPILFLSFTL